MKEQRSMLVTGAGGMVGSYVREVFSDYELTLTDIVEGCEELDVRDAVAVGEAVQTRRPDVVLHLAALTDVDFCEKDPDTAYLTNTLGTENVARACGDAGCELVYISTAGVFWGDKRQPYTEFDPPRAKNVYGDSKWQGEKAVAALVPRAYTCRAGWMIGGAHKDKKFVGMISRMILEGRKEINIVDDKIGSPTYGKDLLGGIHRLLETGRYGLYHMVNQGCISRLDVAYLLRRLLKRDEDVILNAVSSAYFPLPAPRADSEAMVNYKLSLLGMEPMRSWEDALEDYVLNDLMPAMD